MLANSNRASDSMDFTCYRYEPSMPAAVILVVLFGLMTVAHGWLMIKSKTWFMIPFVVGGVFETIGYVGRTLSADQNPGPYTLGPYIIQTIFLLVAPALYAASIYMELGRIVLSLDEDKCLFIRRTWLTKIFVIGDVLSFIVQAGGGGILVGATTSRGISTGKAVVVAGLFAQVTFFGFFVAAAASFHIRVMKQPKAHISQLPWKKHIFSLYIVSVLILVRSVERLAEYLQGYDGSIISNEMLLYIFDGLLMIFAMAVMLYIHPGEVKRLVFASGHSRACGHSNGSGNERVAMDSLPNRGKQIVTDDKSATPESITVV